MITVFFDCVFSFLSCPAMLVFAGFWFVLGCFRLLWWLVGGVENGRLS